LKDTTHTVLEQVQVNSTNLWNGACFTGVGGDLWDGIYAATQNDAVQVSGNGSPFTSDLWIENGVISVSGTAIHQGGDFGGLYIENVDMIANHHGVVYDTALNSTPNQQLFLYPSTQIDSSTGDGIIVNQSTAGAGTQLFFEGWVASSGLDGIHIENCKNCTLDIEGHAVLDNTQNGIELDDTSAVPVWVGGVVTGNATAGASYYGLNCSASMTVYVNTTIAGNTGSRNIAPNCTAVLP
jgi:hypothetical protein